MHIIRTKLIYGALFLVSAFLTACGGGGGATTTATTYTIGGAISGLAGTVVLQNNLGDNLSLSTGASTFTFGTKIASGAAYSVTVLTQPAGQTCTASSNSGTVSGANITDVAVTCSGNTYTIGGNISGLAGTVVLQNNSGNNLSVTTNGNFTFTTPVASGAGYAVTVLTQPAGRRCTVTGGGSGSNVTANVASVAVSCIPVFTISAAVSGLGTPPSIGLVLQNTGNNNLSISADGTLAFSKGLANGESYHVKVMIQPAAPALTCTVTGGSGTMANNSPVIVNISCVTPVPQFAYVANYNSNNVSAYSIANGVLTAIGSNVAGTGPRSVTVVPSGKFAYVANIDSMDISAYTINATGGTLTQISCVGDTTICNSNNFRAGTNPGSVSVDSSGRFAYVANLNSDDISAYTINATTGALTAIAGSPFLAVDGPASVTVDHAGQFAYVANANNDSVSAYMIDDASGALIAVAGSPFTAGTGPQSLDIDPTSRFAYVANAISGSVAVYAIDPLTGALAPVSCGAQSSSCDASGHFLAGTTPTSIVVDPTGKYVYVANKGSNNISAFSIDNAPGGTGALTAIGGPILAGTRPTSITVDLSGKFVYVANYDGANVSAYTIGGTGALSAIAGPFAAGTNPASVITTVVY